MAIERANADAGTPRYFVKIYACSNFSKGGFRCRKQSFPVENGVRTWLARPSRILFIRWHSDLPPGPRVPPYRPINGGYLRTLSGAFLHMSDFGGIGKARLFLLPSCLLVSTAAYRGAT
jgi:hypothetical protein